MRMSVKDAQLRSPLLEAQLLIPRRRRSAKKIVMTLVLTSLVDAFSIMLLYLLVQGSGNGSTLELNRPERLPTAVKSTAVHQGTLVRVDGEQVFLNDQRTEWTSLATRLQQLKASFKGDDSEFKNSLIIEADRNSDFSRLAQVIRAGSVSGFHKFKFAVLQGEGEAL